MSSHPNIILGSQSPRRKEILSYFSFPFTQVTPPFCEEDIPFNGDPACYASTLSLGKAQSLSNLYPDALLITADTVVFREGRSYGKPKDEKEALEMLSELSGHWHSVFTAITIQKGLKHYTDVEETRVLLNPLTTQQIQLYCQAISCLDKAAGYAIQSSGALIVRKIDGCFYNVMGLPINLLQKLLERFNIDLWQYAKTK